MGEQTELYTLEQITLAQKMAYETGYAAGYSAGQAEWHARHENLRQKIEANNSPLAFQKKWY